MLRLFPLKEEIMKAYIMGNYTHLCAVEGSGAAADVQGGAAGGDRRQGDCARDHFRPAQGCDREMLWR